MKPLLLCALFLFPMSAVSAERPLHHEMKIVVHPLDHSLQVEDRFDIPTDLVRAGNAIRFTLHKGLSPVSRTAGVQVKLVSEPTSEESLEATYELLSSPKITTATLAYEGVIFHPLKPPGEEYSRGFGETPGIISEEGVYLSNSSAWYPRFGSELLTFNLDVRIGEGWDVVSQGSRTLHERASGNLTHVIWSMSDPQTELYLIGGPFVEYGQSEPGLEIQAFLRSADPELAQPYIEATKRYIQMYNDLLGNYAYSKFALVENFWETGYGMPSFTLLGPKIIRFPFIINSSYPHEILHNWWGNGVYVDYSTGNWCEGITAYLADHLMKEQQGGGAIYRRDALQKYTDFVTEQNDFPLTQFQERYNAATEAVGYGKALMFQHMLRVDLGDDLYRKGLRAFYSDLKFKRAKFADLTATLSTTSGRDLSSRYHQWVERKGAPELRVVSAATTPNSNGSYELRMVLEQTQLAEVYALEIPVAVHLVGVSDAFQTRVRMSAHHQEFTFTVPGRPFQLDVDPEYDIFRRLHPAEIPPSLSQSFGAKKTLIILPSAATADELAAFRSLARSWSSGNEGGEFETKLDSDVMRAGGIPSDRAVWVLGWKSLFQDVLVQGLSDYDLSIADGKIRMGAAEFSQDGHSLVVSVRNPGNPAQTVSWVAASPVGAIAGLDRKLPHYGKYSALVFEGSEPVNVSKGIWPAVGSPMSVSVTQPDGASLTGKPGKLKPRKALAEEASPFSSTKMKETVDFLASEHFRGRELGSPELDEVAQWIGERFKAYGLQPGGDNGYIQSWMEQLPAPKGSQRLQNVIGFIPGKNPGLAGQSIVIGAHYDHLGLGWPDTHAGNQGKVHYGADDNASGVAVLLELARHYGEKARSSLPDRGIVFVAFTGEEAGLLGSKHFAQKDFFAMLNLDTVGRLGNNKLTIFGAGSAREWPQIFSGVGYVTGVPIQTVASDLGSSDQKSFTDLGVPAVQFFSGAHSDYHRPSDTSDKIDGDGMVKVARVLQESLDYLISRKEALNSTTNPGGTDPGGARKVYLGTVPDFAFEGVGVRLTSVQADSPAEKAGLHGGDIIVQMEDRKIESLKAYSDFLKTLHDGDIVQIHFLRDGIAMQVSATVIER